MFQLQFVWKKLEGRRWMLIVGLLLSAITSAIVIVIPYLTKRLVDDVVRGGATQLLLPIVSACVGLVLLKGCITLTKVFFMEKASQHMLMNLRKSIFFNMQHQEMRFFDRITSGDLITRSTGDLEYMRHFTAYVTYCVVDMVVMFTAAIAMLLFTSIQLTLALLSVMPLLLFASWLYSKKVKPIFRSIRYRLSLINVAAQENIEGNRVVKAFAREDYEQKKFAVASEEFRQANLKAAYAWQKVVPVIDFLSQSLSFINLLVGGLLCINGSITLGELTMFTSLAWAISTPMKNIAPLLNDIQRFTTSADKVIELCCARPLIVDRNDAEDSPSRLHGELEFRDVIFRHKKETQLNGVSFKIKAGQTVGIMGPTGSGKTTISNLAARFYDVNSGSILLDGVDVRYRTLKSVHNAVAVATQDVFLFSDTVENNIAFCNPDLPHEKVVEFARLACADEFIAELSEGYDTIIGERGVGLSGGQRQRLALARALAAQPSVLFLDDTTSAVDMNTERAIRENLDRLPFECTKILIAQRISSVQNADSIIILQDGKVTVGTHDTLCRTNRYYRDVCELQDVQNLPAFEGGER